MFLRRCKDVIDLLCYVVAILFIQSISFSAILFEDNFEDGIIGKEPKNWQYDPDAEVNNIGKIDVDPTNPANKVFTGFGGYLAVGYSRTSF